MTTRYRIFLIWARHSTTRVYSDKKAPLWSTSRRYSRQTKKIILGQSLRSRKACRSYRGKFKPKKIVKWTCSNKWSHSLRKLAIHFQYRIPPRKAQQSQLPLKKLAQATMWLHYKIFSLLWLNQSRHRIQMFKDFWPKQTLICFKRLMS